MNSETPHAVVAGVCLASMAHGAAVTGSSSKPQPSQLIDLGRELEFRAMFTWYSDPRGETDFYDRHLWEGKIAGWSKEGYNAIIWLGANELGCAAQGGGQVLLTLDEFPEAKELPPDKTKRIIGQMKWLFRRARRAGMKNFLYTGTVWVTPAFAKAHGIWDPMPVSDTVSNFHNEPYGGVLHPECGVVNDDTKRYTAGVFEEFARLYEDLDGFYAAIGECLPGDRGAFFRDAIVPGLERSGRKPLIIAHQWQVPLDTYVNNIAPKSVYDNTWLGFHAYNSEQLTDAKPYPGVIAWMEATGLPTVVMVYPANVTQFPFNSPKYAYEIAREMKKMPALRGFVYWEFPQPKLSALFREALAYYGHHREPYSDDRWVDELAKAFGDRCAARHFLNAYNVSGRIIPEMCALVYGGTDFTKRELRIPYNLISSPHWLTSPARGIMLTPIGVYARGEGSWSQGGSVFDITPFEHMEKVRAMGEECLREAEEAMKTVPEEHRAEAEEAYDWMKGYQLLSRYYDRKVAAGVYALMYANQHKPADMQAAKKAADEALSVYLEATDFWRERLDPIMVRLSGQPMHEVTVNLSMAQLIDSERTDRQQIAEIFNW